MRVPATAGGLADLLYQRRAARLKLEAKVDKLKAEETKLKEQLFKLLPRLEATSITGRVATVSIERVVVPTIKSWEDLIGFCVKRKAWDLLMRRVNAKAYRARLDAKEVVAGVEPFVDFKLHCSKK